MLRYLFRLGNTDLLCLFCSYFEFFFFLFSFLFYTVLPLGFKLSCGKSVKYRYIEFFAFDYDSLLISFQSGIAVLL